MLLFFKFKIKKELTIKLKGKGNLFLKEESKLKKIVFKNDRSAFLSIGTVSEVSGGNFKKKDIH